MDKLSYTATEGTVCNFPVASNTSMQTELAFDIFDSDSEQIEVQYQRFVINHQCTPKLLLIFIRAVIGSSVATSPTGAR